VRPQGPYILTDIRSADLAYEPRNSFSPQVPRCSLLALGDTDSSWDFENTRGDVPDCLVTRALHLDSTSAGSAPWTLTSALSASSLPAWPAGALPPDFGLARLRPNAGDV